MTPAGARDRDDVGDPGGDEHGDDQRRDQPGPRWIRRRRRRATARTAGTQKRPMAIPSGIPSTTRADGERSRLPRGDRVELAAGAPDDSQHREVVTVGVDPRPERVDEDRHEDRESDEQRADAGMTSAASSWRSSAGFVSVNHVVAVCARIRGTRRGSRRSPPSGLHRRTRRTAVNSGWLSGSPRMRRNASRVTSAPTPRRGMSVPIWLTAGKVAIPTMRRRTGSPVVSARRLRSLGAVRVRRHRPRRRSLRACRRPRRSRRPRAPAARGGSSA